MIDHQQRLAEGSRRYGTLSNSPSCKTCGDPESSHKDYGGKCSSCGCRSFLQNEEKLKYKCPFCEVSYAEMGKLYTHLVKDEELSDAEAKRKLPSPY